MPWRLTVTIRYPNPSPRIRVESGSSNFRSPLSSRLNSGGSILLGPSTVKTRTSSLAKSTLGSLVPPRQAFHNLAQAFVSLITRCAGACSRSFPSFRIPTHDCRTDTSLVSARVIAADGARTTHDASQARKATPTEVTANSFQLSGHVPGLARESLAPPP